MPRSLPKLVLFLGGITLSSLTQAAVCNVANAITHVKTSSLVGLYQYVIFDLRLPRPLILLAVPAHRLLLTLAAIR